MNEDDHDLLHLDNIVMGFMRENSLAKEHKHFN